MLVLAIGDLHIPERAIDIPSKFKKLLQPTGKIQQVLCLGNSTSSQSTLDFLKSLSLDFQLVKGEFDKDLNLPLSLVFNYDNLKVGLINGFQTIPKADPLSLLTQARLMDVDILIYGSTHKVEAYTLDGKFFINPGSATGAFYSGKMAGEDLEIVESILQQKKENKSTDENGEKKLEDSQQEKASNDSLDPASVDLNEDSNEEQKNDETKDADTKEPTKAKDVEEKNEDAALDSALSRDEHGGEQSQQPIISNIKQKEVEQENEEDINTEDIEDYMDPIPSFCLLDIQGFVCTLYLYTLIDGEVKVDKLTYRKEEK